MSSVFIAVPLPPFHEWRLLADARSCPGGFAIVARIGAARSVTVSDQVALPAPAASLEAAMPASLEELIGLFARLSAERRGRLLDVARELDREAA